MTGPDPPKQRWASAFGPTWVAGIISALVVAALLGLAASLLSRKDEPARETARPLRATIVPVEPETFQLAFDHDIGLPTESERWQDLVKQGGVDVRYGMFKVTLANRSKSPLTIREIYGEVVRNDPAPRASTAFFLSQGDAGLSEFETAITRTAPGSRFDLHKVVKEVTEDTPYFKDGYISLQDGEVYEAKIAVRSDFSTPTTVTYRFVISGSTAKRSFVVSDAATARLSGLDDSKSYAHQYVQGWLEYAAKQGWCKGTRVKQWFKVPPAGLGPTACPAREGV